ncbi:hypothetical protein AncyloWKF20_19205 [Ancylobacter sp. WKF20]|uniref:hypothetical protein n=1 Tax=Ancylobacter sp. WKF20 TaxID=3039801 RepID=UPI0024345881|nr:hypothetical protein [Ancylobacter sp. WKF20]WGD29855.1 hypothetical protein AncyloWKF20_19205 [Ancylobacter sp. WKF20]
MGDSNDQVIGLLRDVLRAQEVLRDEVSGLKTAVAVDVAVSAQHRDKSEARFDTIERALADDIKPQTDEFKRMKAIGVGFLALVAMGGMSIGGVLVYAGDLAVNWVRHWLRIS